MSSSRNILVLAAAVSLFYGCCATKEVIKWQRDTTYIEKIQVDSIYKRDSVMVREKGDTVYIYKEKIRDRYRLIRDTVRLVKIDSVDRPYPVEVEKPLSAFRKAEIEAFPWLVGAIVLLLIWTFRKSIIKLLKI